jgi:hypothetical protein
LVSDLLRPKKERAMNRTKVENDAKGQFAKSEGDRKSDGVASAVPRAVTGKDDATLHKASEKKSPDPGFDIRTQTNNRG